MCAAGGVRALASVLAVFLSSWLWVWVAWHLCAVSGCLAVAVAVALCMATCVYVWLCVTMRVFLAQAIDAAVADVSAAVQATQDSAAGRQAALSSDIQAWQADIASAATAAGGTLEAAFGTVQDRVAAFGSDHTAAVEAIQEMTAVAHNGSKQFGAAAVQAVRSWHSRPALRMELTYLLVWRALVSPERGRRSRCGDAGSLRGGVDAGGARPRGGLHRLAVPAGPAHRRDAAEEGVPGARAPCDAAQPREARRPLPRVQAVADGRPARHAGAAHGGGWCRRGRRAFAGDALGRCHGRRGDGW